jgi:hypothetical protein
MPGFGVPPPGHGFLCVGQKVVLDGDPLSFYRASATWALVANRLTPVNKSVPCAKGLLVLLDVLACLLWPLVELVALASTRPLVASIGHR